MTDAGGGRARLVVVCGLPGAGKTTVAAEVRDRVDGRLLRTDVVRKDLVEEPSYDPTETAAVYDELFSRADRALESGGAAVLDGTFRRRRARDRARAFADERDAAFALVRVECAEGSVRERIVAREGDASDADFRVHRLVREEFEPIECAHLAVDNSGDLASTRAQLDVHF